MPVRTWALVAWRATVRTMKPAPLGRISSTIRRSRRRWRSLLIRREMPTWLIVGVSAGTLPTLEYLWQKGRDFRLAEC